MIVNSQIIEGYRCYTAVVGQGGPIIYCALQPNKDDFSVIVELLKSFTHQSFTLVGYCVNDWNDDLSPWSVSNIFSSKGFAGKGDVMLRWLVSCCIPAIECSRTPSCRFLAGYSLAALFSMYVALRVSHLFDGVACCSGSLWYPHWLDFLKRQTPSLRYLYMSLGDTESLTSNSSLQCVGNCTQQTFAYFSQSITCNTFFEWNRGGHFDHSSERLAKGMAWLLNNL